MAAQVKLNNCFLVALAFSAFFAFASRASAQLVEGNVLLLWNSEDDESSRIREKFVELHPGVVEFDLKIRYADFPDNSIVNPNCSGDCEADCPTDHECECCSCPRLVQGTAEHPLSAINKYYISPSMYEFVRQQILGFLANYEETHPTYEYEPILAIATTRGLPAAISFSFDAIANHSDTCVKSSFEAALAKAGFPYDTVLMNPYNGRIGRSFKWLFTPCGGQEYLRGKIFLVSRLDSDDADGDGDYVDDIESLLERSQHLTVNKFGVTIVYDCNLASNYATADVYQGPVALYMRNHRWCVYFDDGPDFLHGANNPPNAGCGELDPEVEGQYDVWPELAHITLGRNHRVCPGDVSYDCGETVCFDYAKYYDPHPAGYFESLESWNGVALRIPGWPSPPGGDPGQGYQQGSVLHWIGAGGSFTLGRINGTGESIPQFVLPNLYEHGLSWGEAVWTAIRFDQGHGDNYYVPIGDPLARVTVYDPDVDGNGVIDAVDLESVLVGRFDVNGDGIVDQNDLQLVLDVYGRNCWDLPSIPAQNELAGSDAPASPCGDVNHDGAVNQADLDLVHNNLGTTDCPGLNIDLDPNGEVDEADENIVLNHILNGSWCIGDITGPDGIPDGVVSQLDLNALINYLQAHNWIIFPNDPWWNPIYDINCDGNIGRFDYVLFNHLLGHTCPGVP